VNRNILLLTVFYLTFKVADDFTLDIVGFIIEIIIRHNSLQLHYTKLDNELVCNISN